MQIQIVVNPGFYFKTMVETILEAIKTQVSVSQLLSPSIKFDELCSHIRDKVVNIVGELEHIFLIPIGTMAYAYGNMFSHTTADGKAMTIYIECKSTSPDGEPFEVFRFRVTE